MKLSTILIIFSCFTSSSALNITCNGVDYIYSSLGCFQDDGNDRVVPVQRANFRDAESPVYGGELIDWEDWNGFLKRMLCKCLAVASGSGDTMVGLQFYGECWAGQYASSYRRHGWSSSCTANDYVACDDDDKICVGHADTNFLYKLS